MSNPYGDGPEARQALEDELAEVRREYNDYLDSIDSYDAAMDRELDRADHLLDAHKEGVIDLDSPEFAAMVDHFMQRVMR